MDDDTQRPATEQERRAAFAIHGDNEIQVDSNAKVAEAIDGVWVQAWLWVSQEQIQDYGN